MDALLSEVQHVSTNTADGHKQHTNKTPIKQDKILNTPSCVCSGRRQS